MKRSFVHEPLGKSEGDKESPSRSIKQLSERFNVQKAGQAAGRKGFFDALRLSTGNRGEALTYAYSGPML